ncbi:hypothetical protein CDD83_5220 [Cordyceps sp. RAO-2017]|nr:hypothetical protein CDD83_5220 [Cordyceps sp. RAO-2017]
MLVSLGRASARRAAALPPRRLAAALLPRADMVVSMRVSAWARSFAAAAATTTKKKTKAVTGGRAKPKAVAAKGAGAKKSTSKDVKKPKKKAAASAGAKKKKVARKAPKKKKKAVRLTAEEKKAMVVRALRKHSLLAEEPKLLPTNPWSQYIAETMKTTGGDFSGRVKEVRESYGRLGQTEMDRLSKQATVNREANKELVKKWIASQPPELIFEANDCRRRLAHTLKRRFAPIPDDRLPKRPIPSYLRFVAAKSEPGITNRSEFASQSRNFAQAWKGLNAAGKKPFEDAYQAEAEKYKVIAADHRRKARAYWQTRDDPRLFQAKSALTRALRA